ncbi:small, acid-soluble spore protein L [Virgibacillus sp. AGTR]|nr:small, acid-soluble spore protein L [Virgibacillus sp. AGTR]MCC2250922.1 small, acid-soluble spore protein L [Virgibacillus sp. AGTR]QRZ16372.1 small, acid-soluble spore protein L [Virgibacillus sp. AGTR]
MAKDKDQYSKRQVQSSVNTQGLSEDAQEQRPKSQLEQRAKKKNTKI